MAIAAGDRVDGGEQSALVSVSGSGSKGVSVARLRSAARRRLGRRGDAVGEEAVEYGTDRIDADTDTDSDPEEEPQTHGRQPGSSPDGYRRR